MWPTRDDRVPVADAAEPREHPVAERLQEIQGQEEPEEVAAGRGAHDARTKEQRRHGGERQIRQRSGGRDPPAAGIGDAAAAAVEVDRVEDARFAAHGDAHAAVPEALVRDIRQRIGDERDGDHGRQVQRGVSRPCGGVLGHRSLRSGCRQSMRRTAHPRGWGQLPISQESLGGATGYQAGIGNVPQFSLAGLLTFVTICMIMRIFW